ncbi:MAG: hypothetical protein KAR42_06440 [candidate division Zixibacteria bacterium]|nr:hypothetical protein [candidate division Zixibacteria bacterium]
MELKFTKNTDSEEEVKLTPELVSATCVEGAAPAGGVAKVEVLTSFVGNGAKIKITAKTESGKTLGKLSSKIRNNIFVGEIDIPEDVDTDEKIYFEVDFPGNSVNGESNKIPAIPLIIVSNMKWSAYEATRGDKLTIKADVIGCRDNTEAIITIFEYDADNIHDKIVELPAEIIEDKLEVMWEYEYFEDTDEIPTNEEMKEYDKSYSFPEYFFVIEIHGQKFGEEQESGLLTFRDFFEVKFVDRDEMPLAEKKYVIYLPDGSEQEGETDAEGVVRLEKIPPGGCQVDFPDEEDEAEDSSD